MSSRQSGDASQKTAACVHAIDSDGMSIQAVIGFCDSLRDSETFMRIAPSSRQRNPECKGNHPQKLTAPERPELVLSAASALATKDPIPIAQY